MALVLMDQHAGTVSPSASVSKVLLGVEQALQPNHSILRMPAAHHTWSRQGMATWLADNAARANVLIASEFAPVALLRKAGWGGMVVFNALGDLPRGAPALRNALPYLRSTDTVWCSSKADYQIYELLVDADSGPRAVVIPFSVDFATYFPEKEEVRLRFRRDLGIKKEDFAIVYAGRITAEKNFHSVLEAARHGLSMGLKIQLFVAGRIENVPFKEFGMWFVDTTDKIHGLIREHGLSGRVHFLEWLNQTDLNLLYNAADVFLNLTLHHDENFGYTQVEAMCAGLPVIATAWGGLKDAVIQSGAGDLADTWVSDYGIRYDFPRVVSCLRAIAGRPPGANRITPASLDEIRREYSAGKFSLRFNELLITTTHRRAPTTARLTEFGASFHRRFNTIDRTTGEEIAIPPRYVGLSDASYKRLIAPYTSRGEPADKGWTADRKLFLAIAGRATERWFLSGDMLWPARVPIDRIEADMLSRLRRVEVVAREELSCPDETVQGLIAKGLAGASICD